MTDIRTAYRFHRQAGRKASAALADARIDAEAGKRRYPSAGFLPASGIGAPSDGLRWLEKPEAFGLRLVGFADEIACRNYSHASGIDHKGWFTDDHQDETLRGVVYQFPARNGCPVYVPGYADPVNTGAARLSFGDMIEGKRGGCDEGASYDEGARDAAARADHIAERAAERERDYNEAWRHGMDAAEAEAEASQTRRDILAFLRDLRPKKPLLCDAPALIQAARDKVADMLESIRDARERRDNLRDEWSHRDGFSDGYGEA